MFEFEDQDAPEWEICPRCGRKYDVLGHCEPCAKELLEDAFDGDVCPHCSSTMTIRIDTISDDPVVWHSECAACGKGFEVLIEPPHLDNLPW